MNKLKFALTAVAIVACLCVAVVINPVLAFIGLIAFEFCIAKPSACIGVNSFGTSTVSMVIQEALDLVFTKRPILKNISLNLRDKDGGVAQAKQGQVLLTRLFSVPSVQNFGSTESYKSDTDVPVTLGNFKELKYKFSAAEINAMGANRNYLKEVAEPIAIAMSNYFVDAIAALWTIANFPTRTGADAVANGATVSKTIKGAGWDYTHLVDVGLTLDKAGVPGMKRFYVASGNVYGSMLTDLRIVAALNNPNNAGAIESGRLPRVNDFGIEKYVALPTTGNMVAFAGTPDSTAFAVRPPVDPESITGAKFPGVSSIITDPTTGLTVRLDEFIGTDLSVTTRICWLDGAAVGNPNNGQLVTTQ